MIDPAKPIRHGSSRYRHVATRSARVVGGKIVTRAKFPEGTKLILQVDEPAAPVELTDEDEQAITQAVASIRSGKGISLDNFRAILRRL